MNNNNDEPYASYKKICTNLLEEYTKCVLEKSSKNHFACNDKLYLIRKWCMNPEKIICMIKNHNETIQTNKS
jgi:hypothetical protein|uniref:Uncharacterized protein n=1 Tax=viral metagenome TaxID=1070528 RepID=A0A6C0JZZ3_9ZZZZ